MNRDQKANFLKFLDEDLRFDGRSKEEFREVTVTKDVSATAAGSTSVRIGKTHVMAGISMELGTPYSDSPNAGVLMVGVELSPIANKKFETGQPGFDAIELARVTDRGIRESRSIDNEKLCVIKGEKVWIVNVDITVLTADGNLFDACSIAAISAIKGVKLPKVVDGVADHLKKTKDGLPLVAEPIGITIFKVGKHLIVDPTEQEMEGADARLTTSTLVDGTICAMQKGGAGSLTADEVIAMAELSAKKAKELRKLL
jgi:exosome complex component RRP42